MSGPLRDAVAHAVTQLDHLAGLCADARMHDDPLPIEPVIAALDKVRANLSRALGASADET